ncbi:hypothetical protein L1987_57271 [Smallanthus sonchifolius]|uniref:Uncharacterized protein n=1 Tax=Smallanthus sonchifolius TaxID=185202 RepID=A0ACB9DCB9_9ASTR|nr:hypothetical protein L1987_57271 [Smallanthus sonchifolius]
MRGSQWFPSYALVDCREERGRVVGLRMNDEIKVAVLGGCRCWLWWCLTAASDGGRRGCCFRRVEWHRWSIMVLVVMILAVRVCPTKKTVGMCMVVHGGGTQFGIQAWTDELLSKD